MQWTSLCVNPFSFIRYLQSGLLGQRIRELVRLLWQCQVKIREKRQWMWQLRAHSCFGNSCRRTPFGKDDIAECCLLILSSLELVAADLFHLHKDFGPSNEPVSRSIDFYMSGLKHIFSFHKPDKGAVSNPCERDLQIMFKHTWPCTCYLCSGPLFSLWTAGFLAQVDDFCPFCLAFYYYDFWKYCILCTEGVVHEVISQEVRF